MYKPSNLYIETFKDKTKQKKYLWCYDIECSYIITAITEQYKVYSNTINDIFFFIEFDVI